MRGQLLLHFTIITFQLNKPDLYVTYLTSVRSLHKDVSIKIHYCIVTKTYSTRILYKLSSYNVQQLNHDERIVILEEAIIADG